MASVFDTHIYRDGERNMYICVLRYRDKYIYMDGHIDIKRDPIIHVNGSSNEGSRSRSRVSTLFCSAPGWYPCRVLRSLAGSLWLASQVKRAWSRVSGFLVWAVSHRWQCGD